MKFLSPLFFIIFIIACSSTNNMSNKRYYFDENENQTSKADFSHKNHTLKLSKRTYIKKDSGRITRLDVPHYQTYTSSYPKLMHKIENLTNKKFKASPTFIIHYEYLNDLCSQSDPDYTWKRSEINNRKNYYDSQIEKIKSEHQNIVFLAFFEKGIELRNNPKSEEEYFFSDTNDFLRKAIFRNPADYGSFCLIKPDGEILVINGEGTIPKVVLHLKPEVLNAFFYE